MSNTGLENIKNRKVSLFNKTTGKDVKCEIKDNGNGLIEICHEEQNTDDLIEANIEGVEGLEDKFITELRDRCFSEKEIKLIIQIKKEVWKDTVKTL